MEEVEVGLNRDDATSLVNNAFKKYHSILDLASLIESKIELVEPLLVLDRKLPTLDELGHALRLLLQWAVGQLAPGPIQYPLGEYRPFDDPTWQEPAWWRYNILRHRYLEPLHPDDFVEGGRFTETLVSLTGIPSSDTYFDERNRAIREVAERLYKQWNHLMASDELQQLALAEVYQMLRTQPHMQELLGIAATFGDRVFPQTLLLQMAERENLREPIQALDGLITQRFLRATGDSSNLRIASILPNYIYTLQSHEALPERHRLVADYYQDADEPLQAAYHYQKAERWPQAAKILLDEADELCHELDSTEAIDVLYLFKAENLPKLQWRKIAILLSDLLGKEGKRAEAVTACEQALQASNSRSDQAPIQRRLGKLYEQHNHQQALRYYAEAEQHLAEEERLKLFKDRAWIYIFQEEWEKASGDLEKAKELAQSEKINDPAQFANIYNAFFGLYRRQKMFDLALQKGKMALQLRKEVGDPLEVAGSYTNLSLIYTDMGEYAEALIAQEAALEVYETQHNQRLVAQVQLNMGLTHHLMGDLEQAVECYEESLQICREWSLPLLEATIRSNLVEALADLGDGENARKHWQMGYRLSILSDFEEEVAYFEQLRDDIPLLQENDEVGLSTAASKSLLELEPDEEAALEIVQRTGRITPKILMEAINVSKATATRRLAGLVQLGRLRKRGQGRGTYYVAPKRKHADSISELDENDAVMDSQILHQRLAQQRRQITARYPVTALGLLPSKHLVQQMLVRFDKPPSLKNFFELEKELNSVLESHVDLILEDSPNREVDLKGVDWAW